MNSETFDNVWDAIEDTSQEATNMQLRSTLMMELNEYIEHQGWTQTEAARRLGVTQPRISDLRRGKISVFALESLVNMASAAGLRVTLKIAEPAENAVGAAPPPASP